MDTITRHPKIGERVYSYKCEYVSKNNRIGVLSSISGDDVITQVYDDYSVRVSSGDIYNVTLINDRWHAQITK